MTEAEVGPTIKPVLRKPRAQWLVPTFPSGLKVPEDAERTSLLAGTTPAAREILRKLLFGLEQRLAGDQEPLEQIVAWLENRLMTCWALQPEFALLLSRLWGGQHHDWMKIKPRELAILLVLGTRHAVGQPKDQPATFRGP